MAECSISEDQDHIRCPVCLDVMKDPVTTSCGHSFCKVCINDCWDLEDERGVYRCPQCRHTFTTRPVLGKIYMLAEMLEKLKDKKVQTASSAHVYVVPENAECDFCNRRKRKAVKSCLTCQASFCEIHLKPHYTNPSWKRHNLVKISGNRQEKICSKDDEIYSQNGRRCMCDSCRVHEHTEHVDAVTSAAEQSEKQSFRSLCVSYGYNIRNTINQHLSFDGLRKSISDLKKKKRFEEF